MFGTNVEFDWDDGNLDHIAVHGVAQAEVEEAVAGPHMTARAKTVNKEKRSFLFGRTEAGRYITIVFTLRAEKFRTVTAYDMSKEERKRYDKIFK